MGAATCIKYTMILLNALLALGGAIVVGVGCYQIVNNMTEWGTYFFLVVIGIGFAIFFSTFCGCAGGLRESYCLLLAHTILMFLLMSLSTVAVIVNFAYQKQINRFFVTHLKADYCRDRCEVVVQIRTTYAGYILIIIALLELIMVIIGIHMTNQVRRGKQRVV